MVFAKRIIPQCALRVHQSREDVIKLPTSCNNQKKLPTTKLYRSPSIPPQPLPVVITHNRSSSSSGALKTSREEGTPDELDCADFARFWDESETFRDVTHPLSRGPQTYI